MIVDANVFKGFFQLEIGKLHDLCGCPRQLINSASSENPIIHDRGQIMEHEWRNLVDPDWFEGWLASSLASGLISYTDTPKSGTLEKKIATKGFPIGRDLVYVRAAHQVAEQNGKCYFYTEDLDFYDPKKKGCNTKTRQKILKSSSGPVSKILSKTNIYVSCVP
jgi:hypothetical protein